MVVYTQFALKVIVKCLFKYGWESRMFWQLLSSLLQFSHETVTVNTAVNDTVCRECRQCETCILRNMVCVQIRNQWPVIMEISLKGILKSKLYRERVQQLSAEAVKRITVGTQGKTLWAGYMRWDPAGINPFHPTSNKDWQPSSVACKLMECMMTDRLGCTFLGVTSFL